MWNIGDRIELKYDDVVKKRSCGNVTFVYKNGNVKVEITHDPNCKPLKQSVIIISIAPDDLQACHCN